MKRKWIMTVLYVLLICAGIGLLCYDGAKLKNYIRKLDASVD